MRRSGRPGCSRHELVFQLQIEQEDACLRRSHVDGGRNIKADIIGLENGKEVTRLDGHRGVSNFRRIEVTYRIRIYVGRPGSGGMLRRVETRHPLQPP